MARPSREVAVNLPAVEAANERQRAALENKTDAVIPHAEAVVFAGGCETFEIGNLLEGSCGLCLLDHLLDPSQQRGVGNGREVRGKGFPKGRPHTARASC